MKGRVGTRMARVAVVVALGMTVACGGGGGGGGGNDNDVPGDPTFTPTPARTATGPGARTPTPSRTSTPVGGTPVDATATEPELTPGGTPTGDTPTATATPVGGGTTAKVTFDITTGNALFGFQFTVTYPTGKGGFAGSANHVTCSTPSREIFTKNDQDDGKLILSLANTLVLAFPVRIDCRFDLVGGQGLTPADVGITATEVTDETGEVGDPATLVVAVGVS